MSARGEAIGKSRQAKRARRIEKRLHAGKKAGHGPLTQALRAQLRRDR